MQSTDGGHRMGRQKLTHKQHAPLTDDEIEVIRSQATGHGISNGLLARALVLYAMDRIDEPDLVLQIEAEKEANQKRISDGAREAVQMRWDGRRDGS